MSHNVYIKRAIEQSIIRTSQTFPVVILTGARQVGKSTLLQHLVKTNKIKVTSFVTLDNFLDRELANNNPEVFLDKYKWPILIDEIQYAPNLFSYIKVIVEKQRQINKQQSYGMFYLTGSHSYSLMKGVTESLAGRTGIVELLPLSNSEIFNYSSIPFLPNAKVLTKRNNDLKLDNKKIFEIIFKGQYPELYNNPKLSSSVYYESYIQTYIERDVRNIVGVTDLLKFRRFLESVAIRTGQELIYLELAKDNEISTNTAIKWFSILQTSKLVYLLNPYYDSNFKKLTKRPKMYFLDTGLACYLSKINSEQTLELSSFSGQFFETFVVNEIIKSYANDGKNTSMYFYWFRNNSREEIDFIIDINNKLYPIEIKKNISPESKNSMQYFPILSRSKKEVAEGGIICMTNELKFKDSKNMLIPLKTI